MNRKAPAFQFYADDFLAGTFDMTAEETGVYIKLLCLQWSKGVVNSNLDKLSAAIVGSNKETLKSVLDSKFELHKDGWRNERLEQVRSQQSDRSEQARNAANKRWGNDANAHASASNGHMLPHSDEHMPGQCTPSPSPSPRRIDIDNDLLERVEERIHTMRGVIPSAPATGDKLLAWRAAVLSVTHLSENWLVDSLQAVKAKKNVKKPWAYLTRCLRNKAEEMGENFDDLAKLVPPQPPDANGKSRPQRRRKKTEFSEEHAKNNLQSQLAVLAAKSDGG